MFCANCGKQVPDDRLYCEECEAAMNPRTVPAPQEPIIPGIAEAPVTEAAGSIPFNLNTGDGEKPKKKSSAGLIALCASAAVVLVAALLLIFNFAAVKNLYNRTFLAPEDYQMAVQKDALHDAVTSEYGEFLDSLAATSTNALNTQMRLKVGDDILTLLESASGMEDMSWLSDIMLNMSAVQDEDLTQLDLGIGLKNTEIAAIRMIMDLSNAENGNLYLGLPGLSDAYMFSEFSMVDPYGSAIIQQFTAEDLLKILPDEDTFNDLVDRYSDLVLSQLVNVEKGKKTVSCNGIEQKVTMLTTTITAEELCEILTSVCETMDQDEDIRAIVKNAEDVLNNAGFEAEDLYNDFRDSLDTAIESFAETDVDDDDYITLVTYVDYRDNIVGCDLTLTADDDDTEAFLYRSLTDGDKIALSLEIPEANITVEGEGTRKDDKLNVVYSLSVDGQDVGDLELEDVIRTEDSFSGIYRFRPSSEIIEMLLADSGLPVSLISDSVALTFEVQGTKETAEVAIRLVTGGSALVSLEFSGEQLSPDGVTIPDNALSADDVDAMNELLASIDFDKLLSNMEEAGVPSELVSIVSYYLTSITNSIGYDY